MASPVEVALVNRYATRNKPITGSLSNALAQAVADVYGPKARAEVYSGGQPHKGHGTRRTGTTRHDGGRAADVHVYGEDGEQITGDTLYRLGQHWLAKDRGGVGLEMRGGGIHLDEHKDRAPHWSYHGISPAQRDMIRSGLRGESPILYGQAPIPQPNPQAASQQMPNMDYMAVPPLQQMQPNGAGTGQRIAPNQPMRPGEQPAPQQAPQGETMMAQASDLPPASPALEALQNAKMADAAPGQAQATTQAMGYQEAPSMTPQSPQDELINAIMGGGGRRPGVPANAMPALSIGQPIQNRQTPQAPPPEEVAQQQPVAQGGNIKPVSFGSNITPEANERRRQMAEAMMQRSTGVRDIRHPLQGLSQMAEAGVGALQMRQAEQREMAQREALASALQAAFAGGDPSQLAQQSPEMYARMMAQRQAAEREAQQAEAQRRQELADRAAANAEWERRYGIKRQDEIADREHELNVAGAGATNVSAVGNAGEDVPANVRDQLFARAEPFVGSDRKLASIDTARELLANEDIITGVGSGARLALARIGAAAGITDPSLVENTEVLGSTLAQQTLDELNNLKGPATDRDLLFVQKAAQGDVDASAESISRILDIREKNLRGAIVRHNALMDDMIARNPSLGSLAPMLRIEAPGGERIREEARQAIEAGRDPDMINERLREMGLEPIGVQ